MIALHEIYDGDEVEIEDPAGNRVRGLVTVDHSRGTRLLVAAFGGKIPFAQHRPGGWQKVAGIKVTWHQPTIFDAARQQVPR